MPKKKSKDEKPEVHEELKGFELNINEFGQITSSMGVDKLNAFLDENVEDKKLKEKEEKEKQEEESEDKED